MKLTGTGIDEPDDEPRLPQIEIRVIVSAEFAGTVMSELQVLGMIKSMDVEGTTCSIFGTYPSSEFESLATRLASATQGRGKVEHI